MKVIDRVRRSVGMRLLRNAAIVTSEHLRRYLGGDPMYSDEEWVSADMAMRNAVVHSCVRVLSEDISTLSLGLFERKDDGRERVRDHWINKLLEYPNPWQTGMEFREMQQAHLELSGKFFAIKTILRGEVVELLPTDPRQWVVERIQNTWNLQFKFTWPSGVQTIIPNDNVYYMRGLTLDGFTGVNPVEYHQATIGYNINLKKYGTRLFKNGALIGGYLEHPSELGEEAAKRLLESFQEKYAGVGNAHKTILLEEGTKFTQAAMKATDAQYLEQMKYGRSEVAGLYRVPLHMINDLEKATFSNIEEQSLNYAKFGIRPRITRIEKRMGLNLIPKADRDRLYLEHNLDTLLRGDYESRMRGHQIAVLTGWQNRQETRIIENMNKGPVELEEFIVPSNMLAAEMLKENTTKDKKRSGDQGAPPEPANNQVRIIK
jgi:HK97 family phage portal protein